MTFALPQDPSEWIFLVLPLLTIIVGLTYFIAPGRVLYLLGMEPVPEFPGAKGEGRSTFAGFPIGVGTVALLFGQPGLIALLGLSHGFAAIGKLINIAVDGARGIPVLARLLLSTGLAGLSLWMVRVPELTFEIPQSFAQWLILAIAIVTVLFGLLCLASPKWSLSLLRLRAAGHRPAASGELRGTVAGFYLATGLLVLLGGGIFEQLALGAAWLATSVGRMITILAENAYDRFNLASLVLELVLAGLPLAVVFGIVS